MNPYEEKLAQFVEDEPMFNAVKAVLLSQCDLNDASKNIRFPQTSNEQLGELVRGWEQAREIIALGFKEIEKHRRGQKSTGDTANPAV